MIRWGKTSNLFIGVALAWSLIGCAVTSPPLTPAERDARIDRDLTALFADQEPAVLPITFAEAVARTIKYNLEHRVALMEQAVASRQLDLARANLMPQVVASIGYTDRSNQSGSSSQSLLSGEQSLEPSTSQEREQALTDLTIAWNFLDFGVSYLAAKQQQDSIHIVAEQRRKAIQNLIQDVVDAYWRAWNAQDLANDVEETMSLTEAALERSHILVAKGTRRKKDSLVYQRSLLEIHSRLWQVRQDLSLARTRLARLMNLPPATSFRLATKPELTPPGPLIADLDELEKRSLQQRPELSEEDYQLRISQHDVRKALLRRFPGLEIHAGTHYDSNDFLFNKDWSDAGLRITWNLLGLISGGREKRMHEARVELANARRLNLSMAVLTQVRLASQRYELARQRYSVASDLADIDDELWRMTKAGQSTQTELDLVRARATAVSSKMSARLAFAEVQQSLARVLNSVGEDPLPTTVDSHDLRPLATAIDRHWNSLVVQYIGPGAGLDVDEPSPDEIAFQPQVIVQRKRILGRREEPALQLVSTPELNLRPKRIRGPAGGDPELVAATPQDEAADAPGETKVDHAVEDIVVAGMADSSPIATAPSESRVDDPADRVESQPNMEVAERPTQTIEQIAYVPAEPAPQRKSKDTTYPDEGLRQPPAKPITARPKPTHLVSTRRGWRYSRRPTARKPEAFDGIVLGPTRDEP